MAFATNLPDVKKIQRIDWQWTGQSLISGISRALISLGVSSHEWIMSQLFTKKKSRFELKMQMRTNIYFKVYLRLLSNYGWFERFIKELIFFPTPE